MRHTPGELLSIDEVRAIAAVRDALATLPPEARLRVLRRLRQLDAGARGASAVVRTPVAKEFDD